MNKASWLISAALAAAPAAAAYGQAGAPAKAAPSGEELSKEQAEQALSQCSSKRFQSTAEFEVDGKMRRTGVTVCAQPGDSDSAWIERLQKAAATVEAQQNLPQSAKSKLATDIRNEIARLKLKKATLPAADALVATVPPMPAPRVTAPQPPPGALPVTALLSAPPLTIRCLESGERGQGRPCDEFKRNTVLMVQADSDLTAPATLRFVRKGRLRSELGVGRLRQGEIKQLRIPGDVCAGVVRSQLAIEIVGRSSGSAAPGMETIGPLELRC
jgi:hypothetical protein